MSLCQLPSISWKSLELPILKTLSSGHVSITNVASWIGPVPSGSPVTNPGSHAGSVDGLMSFQSLPSALSLQTLPSISKRCCTASGGPGGLVVGLRGALIVVTFPCCFSWAVERGACVVAHVPMNKSDERYKQSLLRQ